MNFNSFHFLIFLPVVLILYWLLPHKARWVALLIASYYFYMSWNAWLIFPIVGTTLISYGAGLLMPKTKSKALKKFYIVFTLIVCIGLLVFFKYFNFLLGNVIDFLNLFSLNLNRLQFDILLPVGISFYTFQTLSYVIDVYRDNVAPEKHLGYYALYVSFFPQLVAGPIERPQNLLPQLREEHKINKDDLAVGARIMMVGFIRKCIVADFLGTFVNSVYGNVSGANAFSVLVASALFLLQVYNDFAGYSEIATGVARMMGIKLMVNFNRPFYATSITDFGRRWHISLNTWFRDYLYIPLGGNRKGKFRKYFNMFIVYALCGMWHGASWTYLFWGVWLWVFLTVEDILRKPYRNACKKLNIDNNAAWIKFIKRAIVILVCTLASVFFRATSVTQIGEVYVTLFTKIGFGAQYFTQAFSSLSMTILDFIELLLVIACLFVIPYITEYKRDVKRRRADYKLITLCKKQGLFGALRGKKNAVNALLSGGEHLTVGNLEGKLLNKSRGLYAKRVATILFGVFAIALAWLILIASGDASAFVYFQF